MHLEGRATLPLLSRGMASEALGTGFLLIAVVGSGIVGERLAGGNVALALLVNALATAAALFALIEWLEPLFNERLETRDGRMLVPTRPGLGLSLSDQVKPWTAQQVEVGKRP